MAERGIARHFNSRPSARGDGIRMAQQAMQKFQFTPLREGRPIDYVSGIIPDPISIHAPPRGATGQRHNRGIPRNFNSRPSARGDNASNPRTAHLQYFNSRPSARGDELQIFKGACPKFQFTPLREGRPATQSTTSRRSVFQFTPLREGRPARPRRRKRDGGISIHAPPRGATGWA